MWINRFIIYQTSVLYLIIPIFFFFMGWLRTSIGLLLSIVLLTAYCSFSKLAKNLLSNDSLFHISKEHCVVFVILFIFLLCTGNTGFIGCWGNDIPWRNAIYQDLIHQPWPVIYDYSHSILCYYITFWLLPAQVTSWLNLNEFGSNTILFLWMYLGLVLIFLLLCDILQPQKGHVLLVAIVFLFFSGINTLGMILRSFFIEPTPLITNTPGWGSWEFTNFHINGKDIVYLIRSTYINISDVYNQYFALAVSTLLFFRFRGYLKFYALIGLLTLPYSPIGFIGLLIVMFLDFIWNLCNKRSFHGYKKFVMEAFSATNSLAVLSIFPVFYFYYSMNVNATVILNSKHTTFTGLLYIPWEQFSVGHLVILIIYYYLYFIIYARLIYDDYKNDYLYWIILLCLIMFPFFRIGTSSDFNFTATICPYLILCVLIQKHILKTLNSNCFSLKDLLLIFFLSIAMLTPVIQITSSLRGAYVHNTISYKDFSLQNAWDSQLLKDSLRDKDIKSNRNFLAKDFERKVFYRIFAKR